MVGVRLKEERGKDVGAFGKKTLSYSCGVPIRPEWEAETNEGSWFGPEPQQKDLTTIFKPWTHLSHSFTPFREENGLWSRRRVNWLSYNLQQVQINRISWRCGASSGGCRGYRRRRYRTPRVLRARGGAERIGSFA